MQEWQQTSDVDDEEENLVPKNLERLKSLGFSNATFKFNGFDEFKSTAFASAPIFTGEEELLLSDSSEETPLDNKENEDTENAIFPSIVLKSIDNQRDEALQLVAKLGNNLSNAEKRTFIINARQKIEQRHCLIQASISESLHVLKTAGHELIIIPQTLLVQKSTQKRKKSRYIITYSMMYIAGCLCGMFLIL
jgi:hypothetical protein